MNQMKRSSAANFINMSFLFVTAVLPKPGFAQSGRYLTPGIYVKGSNETIRAMCVDGSSVDTHCSRVAFEINGLSTGRMLSSEEILQKFDLTKIANSTALRSGKSDEYSKGFPYAVRVTKYKIYHIDSRSFFWKFPLRDLSNQERVNLYHKYLSGDDSWPLCLTRFYDQKNLILKRIETATPGKYIFVYVLKDHVDEFDSYVSDQIYGRGQRTHRTSTYLKPALNALINQTLAQTKPFAVSQRAFSVIESLVRNNDETAPQN